MAENDNGKSERIVTKMFENDAFSRWLGISILEALPGKVSLSLIVRKEFTNGFGVAHGGITYSLADSALAFSANGHGRHALSIETSVSHTRPVMEGDILTAHVEELVNSRKLGIYHINIYNQHSELVALFKGTVFKKDTEWDV